MAEIVLINYEQNVGEGSLFKMSMKNSNKLWEAALKYLLHLQMSPEYWNKEKKVCATAVHLNFNVHIYNFCAIKSDNK